MGAIQILLMFWASLEKLDAGKASGLAKLTTES